MKVYVCDTWDSLSDIGESIIDKRAYVTRDAAERRAERIRRSGCDEIEEYARVVELELCAEPTDADKLIAERTVWYLHARNVEAENAKLRKSLERAAGIIADICGECPACRYEWLSSDGCAEKCGTVTEEECWIAYLTGKRWDESGAEVDR